MSSTKTTKDTESAEDIAEAITEAGAEVVAEEVTRPDAEVQPVAAVAEEAPIRDMTPVEPVVQVKLPIKLPVRAVDTKIVDTAGRLVCIVQAPHELAGRKALAATLASAINKGI